MPGKIVKRSVVGIKASNLVDLARGNTDWDYFRFGTFLKVKLEPHGNNEFEPILVVSSQRWDFFQKRC